MSKNKKEQPKGIFQRVNEAIVSLNKIAILIIFILYAGILTLILSLTTLSPKEIYSYPYVPNYEHLTYNDDVGTLLKIVYQYDFDINNKLDKSIGINTILNTFPGRETKNRKFMPKALLTNGKMHYFSQYDNYENVNHHLNFPNGTDPKSIFIAMEYIDKEGQKKYYTLREDLFTLSKDDLNKYQETYDNTNIIITIQSEQGENNIMVDLNINVKDISTDQQKLFYHVDVQTWVVTKDKKIYPFIGFYNFTNIQRNTMSDYGKYIPVKLNAEYFYVKVKYYNSLDKFVNNINHSQEILYKIPISQTLKQ